MQYANIHTHTTFSDGKNTPEEMILKAIELGFSSIGISDHSETAFDSAYCMGADAYPSYRKSVNELKEKYGDRIDVLCGIERDSYSPVPCEGFDYIIGSVHYILYGRYYDLVAEHALRKDFEVLGHFDLLNKFGLFSDCTEEYRAIALEALDACLSAVPYIEMNTGAISRGYKAVYPDDFFLRHILEKGGKIVLNGDSHSAQALDCHFDASVAKLKEIGFASLWQLGKNGWHEVLI